MKQILAKRAQPNLNLNPNHNPNLNPTPQKPQLHPKFPSSTQPHKKPPDQIKTRAKTYAGSGLNKTMPSAGMGKTEPNAEGDLYHPDIYHRPEIRKKYFCDLVDSYMSKRIVENFIAPKMKIMHNMSIVNRYQVVQEEANSEANSNDITPVKLVKAKRALTAGHSRKVATQSSEKKLKKATDSQNSFYNLHPPSNKKQTQTSSIQSLHPTPLKPKDPLPLPLPLGYPQLSNKNYSKLQMLKTYLKSNKNIRNYEKRSEMMDSRKYGRLEDEEQQDMGDGEGGDSVGDSQNLDDQSIQGNGGNQGCFGNFGKDQSRVGRFGQSRLKTMSKVSTSMAAFSSKTKSTSKIIDVKQFADFSIDTENLEQDINRRLKLINSRYSEQEWKIIYMKQHTLYQVFYLCPVQDKSNSQLDSKPIPKLKIKKFKQSPCSQKSLSTIQKLKPTKLSNIWSPLPTPTPSCPPLHFSPPTKPLLHELFAFSPQKSPSSSSPIYHIHLTQSYHKLFHNNCQYFRDIIVALAENLRKMSGKVINNRITLDNVYVVEEKIVGLGDWGCAALRREMVVAGKDVVFKDQPILGIQGSEEGDGHDTRGKWLVSVESLPPEIIQCLIAGVYSRIWQIEECPEVWSLGIMIFEILSCIPVWMPHLCTINHKIPKRGIFYDRQKRLTQILSHQYKMPSIVSKWLRDQKSSPVYKNTHPQILTLMKSMLQLPPKNRPTPTHIINKLKITI